jgi:hypothetical protein
MFDKTRIFYNKTVQENMNIGSEFIQSITVEIYSFVPFPFVIAISYSI